MNTIFLLGIFLLPGSQSSSIDPMLTVFDACDANGDTQLTLDEVKELGCMDILENLSGLTEDKVKEKFLEMVKNTDGQSLDRSLGLSRLSKSFCFQKKLAYTLRQKSSISPLSHTSKIPFKKYHF